MRRPLPESGTSGTVFKDRAIDDFVDAAARAHPAKPAIVDRFGVLTWAEVEVLSRRLAAGLASLGVRQGDRVAVQLPNWRHFPLLEYALSRLGAICVPLPAIYRERELKFMLGLVCPVVVVVPSSFRDFDHATMVEGLRPMLPSLRGVVVVGAPVHDGHVPFDALISGSRYEGAGRTDPNAVTEIVFTSGTTGEPKGVMHSANSNMCPLFSLIAQQGLDSDETILMGSTFGHQTGFVYGGQLPAVLGGTLVLLDRWDAKAGAALIREHQVTWTMGATPFLQDLAERASREDLASLRTFLCSGAPIPPSLLATARMKTGAFIASGWGMTEVGLVTLARPGDGDEQVSQSDGRAFDCMEIRTTDDQGVAACGIEGDLWCRGPSMFLGYYERPELTSKSFSGDGWFGTGDRGRVDASGYLRIVGRTKDIVIRGGENIPVTEVEDLLRQHPAVDRVAVVGVPDQRLQERACAVVVPREASSFTLEDMQRHLLNCRMAQQYVPEHLVLLHELPMTPSGKVQKFVLRKQVVELLIRRNEITDAKTA